MPVAAGGRRARAGSGADDVVVDRGEGDAPLPVVDDDAVPQDEGPAGARGEEGGEGASRVRPPRWPEAAAGGLLGLGCGDVCIVPALDRARLDVRSYPYKI